MMPQSQAIYDIVSANKPIECEITDLVECDLCGQLLPLVGVGQSTTYLRRHCDSHTCHVLQRLTKTGDIHLFWTGITYKETSKLVILVVAVHIVLRWPTTRVSIGCRPMDL